MAIQYATTYISDAHAPAGNRTRSLWLETKYATSYISDAQSTVPDLHRRLDRSTAHCNCYSANSGQWAILDLNQQSSAYQTDALTIMLIAQTSAMGIEPTHSRLRAAHDTVSSRTLMGMTGLEPVTTWL